MSENTKTGLVKKRHRTSSIVQFIFYFWSFDIRRDVPVGVPLDLSTPTGMSCIGTYGENCKSDNV